MKSPLLILILFLFTPQTPEWKQIKEFSGDIPNNPGLTLQTSASEITRGDDIVKLLVRFDMPQGAPWSVFRNSAPSGFDVSSVTRVEGKIELNCRTHTIKAIRNSAEVYQFNGRKFKSKEPPFQIPPANVFAQYFCEQGTVPTQEPVLKPKS